MRKEPSLWACQRWSIGTREANLSSFRAFADIHCCSRYSTLRTYRENSRFTSPV